ncbi:hypothetical protein ABPG77_009879 [Micractinium sp. CCAP 211/92]
MEAAFGGSMELLLTLPSAPLSLDPCGPSVFGAGPVVALPGLDSPLAPLPPADAPPVGQSAAEQQPALPGLAAFMGQPGSLEPTLSFLPTMGAPPAPAVGFAMAPPALDGKCYAGGPAAWTGNVTMFPAPAPLANTAFPPLPLPQPSGLDKQQVKAQQAQGQPQAPAPAPARSAVGGGERRCRSASVGRTKAAPRARRGRKASTHSDSDDSEALSDLEAEEGDESDREQAAAAAARKERVRAKNRRAQARYRQKQKELQAQQHREYEAAQADLERELEANRRLREQGAALEKIASFKDLSLQALEEGSAGAWAGDSGASSQLRPTRQLTTEALLQELALRESRGRAVARVGSNSSGAGTLQLQAAPDSGSHGSASSAELKSGASAAAAPKQDSNSDGVAASATTALQPQAPGMQEQAEQHPPAPAASPQRPQPASSGSSGGSSTGTANSSGSGLRQLPFEQRAVEVVSVMCPGVAAAASELAASAGEEGVPVLQQLTCRSSGALLASSPEAVRALLQQEVMAMSEHDFLEDWGAFGKLAAETIAELDACHISEPVAVARLKPAVTFRALLHTLMLHQRPDIYRRLLGHTRMPDDTPEQTAARWRQAALAMGCTRAQAVQLRQRYDEYCAKLARLGRDCAASMLALSRAAAEAQQHLSVTAGGSFLADLSMRSMMQEYLRVSASCHPASGSPRRIAYSRPCRTVPLHLSSIACRPAKQTWVLLPQACVLSHRKRVLLRVVPVAVVVATDQEHQEHNSLARSSLRTSQPLQPHCPPPPPPHPPPPLPPLCSCLKLPSSWASSPTRRWWSSWSCMWRQAAS